ncbi:MAG TPA: CDP-alcohol phosphatidyltransferase family protein [Saprospiraceae bacterium]|nr:CDP-alcohol phosphatidyltransferase family protein [Saprospiraceae bacterium]HPG07177.1 CDP-alcohol phosphatidyltransferase family protein [Saprospiraceae bacterium]HRV85735.1 CDP-alcohol phosphatidyltransferase family protein [Saprospiraceae bacterium]
MKNSSIFVMTILSMKRFLADIVTLFNLFLGCTALIFAGYQQFIPAFWLLFAAGWADFLDGMVARAVGSNSSLGVQLDSLADMVSFGVVPGMIMVQLLGIGLDLSPGFNWTLLGFTITVFSCIRLAIFNVKDSGSQDFSGLPTPSSTGLVAGWGLAYAHHPELSWMVHPVTLIGITLLVSVLMVSRLPMVGMKFKNWRWQGNAIRYVLIATGIILLIILKEWAFSALIAAYITLSAILFLIRPGTAKKVQDQ